MVFYEFYSCYSVSFILSILRVCFSVFCEFRNDRQPFKILMNYCGFSSLMRYVPVNNFSMQYKPCLVSY